MKVDETRSVGIVVRDDLPEALNLARKLSEKLRSQGCRIFCEQGSGICSESDAEEVPVSVMVSQAFLIITLGGDGTLMRVARLVTDENPVLMLGVNFGKLGVLTEIRPEEILDAVESALDNRLPVEERNMLFAQVLRNEEVLFSGPALNDAVIQKGSRDRLLELEIAVNGEMLTALRADGIILAPPTGSTAYSLAAGGSIVHPSLETLQVTPICPHSLTSRPFIIPLHFDISVRIPDYEGQVYISLDGQESFALQSGDELRVSKHRSAVKLARNPHKNYFAILRDKLNWGLPNKA